MGFRATIVVNLPRESKVRPHGLAYRLYGAEYPRGYYKFDNSEVGRVSYLPKVVNQCIYSTWTQQQHHAIHSIQSPRFFSLSPLPSHLLNLTNNLAPGSGNAAPLISIFFGRPVPSIRTSYVKTIYANINFISCAAKNLPGQLWRPWPKERKFSLVVTSMAWW